MIALAGLALLLAVPQAAPAQDPALDNLVHAPGYETAPLGSLGAVVEKGRGPVDVLLVSGFGLGASAFAGFQERNAERYHTLAVTLAGFEGTPAPPMPPAGTSYGAQTWTDAAVDGLEALVVERGLERVVLVGHFLNGPQVVTRLAARRPERVRALVLLAASPRFEPRASTPSWPAGLTLEQKVAFVDQGLAPRWFRTVTRATWVAGNFAGGDYSLEPVRGEAFAERANAPPLPVLVRWLCEFHASDLVPELARLDVPLLVLRPSWPPEVAAEPARGYLASFFEVPWEGALAGRAHTRLEAVEGAGILLQDDRPEAVDAALASFLEREAPAPATR